MSYCWRDLVMEIVQKIKKAEEQVLAEPDNSANYFTLLLAYLEDPALFGDSKRTHYIKEAVQRFPKATLCQSPVVNVDAERSPTEYNEIEGLWLNLLDKEPENIQIVKGAANFYSTNDQQKACDILKKAIEQAPESDELWFDLSRYTLDEKERLSHLLSAVKCGSTQPNLIVWIASTAVSVEEFDIAQQYAERLFLLIQEAKELFGAKLNWRGDNRQLFKKASELMDEPEARKLVRSIGTNNYHKHWANTVLGQIALIRDSDERAALEYLAASGDVGHDARLSSYGPSMMLVKSLSKLGHWEASIDYLRNCQSFWETSIIEDWIEQLQRKQQPDWLTH